MDEDYFIPRIIKRLHVLGENLEALNGPLLKRVAFMLSVNETVAEEMIVACGFNPTHNENDRRQEKMITERQLTLF